MMTDNSFRHYLTVTFSYWAFTITDGAIRMLVVLYFHQLGYSPFQIASLFLFYELFGVITNLLGGWIASRIGLNVTLHLGIGLQVIALSMLAVNEAYLTVPYVMFAQALSGIAKDLNKMSAKSSVKLFASESSAHLFKWVAALTGSKNTLKGAGFFIGAFLLSWIGFQSALLLMAAMLLLVLLATFFLLPRDLGRMKKKIKFTHLFSRSEEINWLSAARFFLFGARDIWFVVGLPVYLSSVMGWSHNQVGTFFALWIIAYGLVQAFAPKLIRRSHHQQGPDGVTAQLWVYLLAGLMLSLAMLVAMNDLTAVYLIFGLVVFAVLFAVNSAIHSYLILHYSQHENVTVDVGFYYMSNAAGRLTGTILSGLLYQYWGLSGCLWVSAVFILVAGLLSVKLPRYINA
ncbi:MAG: organoarsenical effux MFS transporter ArsJ [Gammaproteobacteria bacterium]|nr:organoarsenical effux MFS transporter ArsJ [Gammaproteobacteria bacterium]